MKLIAFVVALLFGVCRAVQVPLTYGVRPFYLVDDMWDSDIKVKLTDCMHQSPQTTDFSIGHRGAALQFPEHTRESYIAAARMGAGMIECDVTFTKDLELVCRHSQCDLHTTTNILATNLASKCTQPFKPATDYEPASALCCTSDITLAEFKSLTGKMDASVPTAKTVEEYLGGTANWRTDLYSSSGTVGTLVSHAESIELLKELGAKMIPELKAPSVPMPFKDFTYEMYAQKLVDEYEAAGVDAERVWLQSFNLDDILYWVQNSPQFGLQAIYLDERYELDSFDAFNMSTYKPTMNQLYRMGVRYIAPPLWMLLSLDSNGQIIPAHYGYLAYEEGLNIITWTLERSGAPPTDFYMQTIQAAVTIDGDVYNVLDVLAKNVGIKGIFSDWPATVTYYANCMQI